MVKHGRHTILGTFRKKHVLEFKGWEIQYPDIFFYYSTEKKDYHCTVSVSDIDEEDILKIPAEQMSYILSTIGLSFVTKFYALQDFKTIKSHPPLTRETIDFFETSLLSCLSEHRYREGLDPKRKIDIIAKKIDSYPATKHHTASKMLILNGGGKDSAVSSEIAKSLGIDLALLSVNKNQSQENIAKISEIKVHHSINFKYDPEIYKNNKYSFNAIPHILTYNFLSHLHATIHNYRYIVSGNEFSSNFGNITYRQMSINHQWPKSYEFEKMFSRLAKKHLYEDIEYFSILRPFYDIQLGHFFSQHPGYSSSIVSCNVDPKNWCKKCAKCAFTYITLLAFSDKKSVTNLFGHDLLLDPEIRREILELIDESIKPWECVGTKEECRSILSLVFEKEPDIEFKEWPYRKDLEKYLDPINKKQWHDYYRDFYNLENLIPESIDKKIKYNYLPMIGSRQ